MFRKTKLRGVTVPVQQAFKKKQPELVDKIVACAENRFSQTSSCFSLHCRHCSNQSG